MRPLFLLLLFLGHVGRAQPAAVRGTIKDKDGKPLSGVLITIPTGAEYAGDLSDRDGSFYLPAVEPGQHSVRLQLKGYAEAGEEVFVTAGKESVVAIVLQPKAALSTIGKDQSDAATVFTAADSIRGFKDADFERVASRNPLDVTSKSSGTYSARSGAGISIGGGRAEASTPMGEVVAPTRYRKHLIAPKSAAPTPAAVEADGGHASLPPPIPTVARDDASAPRYMMLPESSAPSSPDVVTGEVVSRLVGASQPAAQAGSLTSGESNDFSKWTLWEDMARPALEAYRKTWNLHPARRYSVAVQSSAGTPVVGAAVRLMDGSTPLWTARTDNTGRAELWAGFTDTSKRAYRNLYAEVVSEGRTFRLDGLKPFGTGANNLKTNLSCSAPRTLDVAFIVDATGSMQDEINYLKAELTDILQRVRDSSPGLDVRTAALYYRDLHDEYAVLPQDFSPGIAKTVTFLSSNNAGGGGDRPEAVDMALDAGLSALSWRDDAATKLAFLVLDAPPHDDPTTVARISAMTAQYAARGIRLIPVACSGVEKSDEYLLRSMALATNGTYLFLTNHSGIGGSHTEPTTDRYDVEYLNALVYRVIHQFSYVPECRAVAPPVEPPPADTAVPVRWSFYPNPTSGLLTVEYDGLEGPFYVCDITGKAILQVPASGRGKTTVDLRQYPAGVYFLRYSYAPEKWLSGKVILQH